MLAKGRIVDGYRIDGVVGEGGLGVVYEATQLETGRRVALKVLDPTTRDLLGGDEAVQDRFRRQAALRQPHLLTAFDIGTVRDPDGADAGLYVAMPLLEGSTLGDLIAGGSLDAERALRLLAPVADALDDVHAAGLVHGHVKPQNILVAPGDHAYLTDVVVPAPRAGSTWLTQTGCSSARSTTPRPRSSRGASAGPRATCTR